MTSAKAIPSNARRLGFTVFAAIVLASAPSFVFAQRGGGHGGGGGAHGGGGSHGAGGFSGSSGRSTSGGPSAGSFAARSYRAAPSAPTYSRPSSSYARPGGNSYRSAPAPYSAPYSGGRDAYRAPAGNRGTAYVRGGASGATASHAAPSDGQWHSFAQASGSSRSTNAGTARTFVGQGQDLYEEGPRTGGASAAARPGTTASASGTVSSSLRSSSPAASTAFASHSLVARNTLFGQRTFAAAGIAGAASGTEDGALLDCVLLVLRLCVRALDSASVWALYSGQDLGLGLAALAWALVSDSAGILAGARFGMIPSASADSPDRPMITTGIRLTIRNTIRMAIRRRHLHPIRTTAPATNQAARRPIHNLPRPRSL